jgi:phage shock protein A
VNLEHLLDLIFRSNVLIIEVLFGVVLTGIIFLTIRAFTRPEGAASDVNLQGLEDGIKKILENYSPEVRSTRSTQAVGGESEGSSIIVEELNTQVERLKIQLMQKSEEVEQLKASVGSLATEGAGTTVNLSNSESSPAASSLNTGENGAKLAEYEEKIRDLEARLNEYSIIEDDIADLSFYKEETVRLQGEVDRLKEKLSAFEAGGVAAPVVPTAVRASSPAPSVGGDPIPVVSAPTKADTLPSLETSPLVETKSVPEPMAKEISSQPLDASAVDDDIMAEFERAVAEQKAVTNAQKTATEVPLSVVAPVVEVAAEPESEHQNESDDGGINLDKMLSEVGSLPEQETEDVANVLDQALDTEKLLQEATGMDKMDADALNEFDLFLKKEGA